VLFLLVSRHTRPVPEENLTIFFATESGQAGEQRGG
jgi:hypothetical protein